MRTLQRITVTFFLLLVALAAAPKRGSADDAAPISGERAAMIQQIDAAESELLQLADAVPDKKYAWRPGKGVRSVGEVYMHVAGANYFLPTLYGVAPPAGIDLKTYEASVTEKAKIIDALKTSFAHAKKSIADTPDGDLTKTVKIFGKDGTERDAMMIVVTHAHEHLGQSIAYARMNGVVPPWTAARQAAAPDKK